MKWFFS